MVEDRRESLKTRENKLKSDIDSLDIEYQLDDIAKLCGVKEKSFFVAGRHYSTTLNRRIGRRSLKRFIRSRRPFPIDRYQMKPGADSDANAIGESSHTPKVRSPFETDYNRVYPRLRPGT